MEATSFLESLLKWASVAYALGFVTVMVNTARIGVPTLQLLDPVQIWVGIPLAVVFWLILQAAKYYRKRAEQVTKDIQLLQEQYVNLVEIAKSGDFIALSSALLKVFLSQTTAIGLPLTYLAARMESAWFSRLSDRSAGLLKKSQRSTTLSRASGQNSDELMTTIIGLTKLFARISVWVKYATNAINVAVLLVGASLLYVLLIYPTIPQSWGGGRPTLVRMSLEREKLPPELSDVLFLFPKAGDSSEPPKARLSLPLTLLYATDHAYYIRLTSGKVMQISPEAVSAIVFDTGVPTAQSSQTSAKP